MIRIATLLARDDLRCDPTRAVTVTLLVALAAFLPAAGLHPAIALVASVLIAVAATAGTVGAQERRLAVLDRNGAGAGTTVLTAVATIAVPAVAGAVLAVGAAGLLHLVDGERSVPYTAIAVLALVGPTATAGLTAASLAPRREWGLVGRLLFAAVLLASLTTIVVPLALFAVLVARWATHRGRTANVYARTGLTVAAFAVAAVSALLLGASSSFFDLGIALMVVALPLTFAVGWLSGIAVRAVGAVAGHAGPTAHLAVGAIAARRRELTAITAAVAVMATLAAADGVVGASFGEREARSAAASTVDLGRAGTADDQAIVVTSWATPEQVAAAVADVSAADEVVAVPIGRLGVGGTQIDQSRLDEEPQFLDLSALVDPGPTTYVEGRGPVWIGVIEPDDLAPLGLAAAADDLAAGNAIVLNPSVPVPGGRIGITRTSNWTSGLAVDPDADTTVVTWPAVRAELPEPALLLPAVLVSPAAAADIDPNTGPARVVVAPAPGRSIGPDAVLSAAGRVDQQTRPERIPGASALPTVTLADGTEVPGPGVNEATQPPIPGGDRFTARRGPSQNAVPVFAEDGEQGRDRVLVFAGLALAVTLAATILTLARSRAEDAILEVHGAPSGLRAGIAAIQAAVVAGAGSLVGLTLGVGLSVAAMAQYNASYEREPILDLAGRTVGQRILDIPIVVPPLVFMALLALPLAAAALAAVVVSARPAPDARVLADAA